MLFSLLPSPKPSVASAGKPPLRSSPRSRAGLLPCLAPATLLSLPCGSVSPSPPCFSLWDLTYNTFQLLSSENQPVKPQVPLSLTLFLLSFHRHPSGISWARSSFLVPYFGVYSHLASTPLQFYAIAIALLQLPMTCFRVDPVDTCLFALPDPNHSCV